MQDVSHRGISISISIYLYFPSILYTRYGRRHVSNTKSYRAYI
jgi:hypothetical protein